MDGPDPDDLPFGGLFRGLPIFGDLAKAFASQGPLHWDAARQFATLAATGGEPETNVDPAARIEFEQLVRVADLHVQEASGLDTSVGGRPIDVMVVTPSTWAHHTLEAYRPLFTELATSLSTSADTPDEDSEPALAMLAGLNKMIAPAMLGMAVGSMVGQLARRTFGQYDLPVPRTDAGQLLVVSSAVDSFADDWSVPRSEMRMWVLIQELAGHAVLQVPHLRERLVELVRAHVGAFRPDPSSLFDHLGDLDPADPDALGALQNALSDPTVILGAVTTPQQDALRVDLDALLAVVVGVVDHVVDRVAPRVLGDGGRIAEAVRRRRIEATPEAALVERLLGLHLDRVLVQRGRSFVSGVVERAGDGGLDPLFTRFDGLPTPPEVEAPGLWLARLDLGS